MKSLPPELVSKCISYLDSDTKWAVVQDKQLREYVKEDSWLDWYQICLNSQHIFKNVFERPPFSCVFLPKEGITIGKTKVRECDMYALSILEIETPQFEEVCDIIRKNGEFFLVWHDGRLKELRTGLSCCIKNQVDIFI